MNTSLFIKFTICAVFCVAQKQESQSPPMYKDTRACIGAVVLWLGRCVSMEGTWVWLEDISWDVLELCPCGLSKYHHPCTYMDGLIWVMMIVSVCVSVCACVCVHALSTVKWNPNVKININVVKICMSDFTLYKMCFMVVHGSMFWLCNVFVLLYNVTYQYL